VKKRVNWFSSLSNKYKEVIIDQLQENEVHLDNNAYYKIMIQGKLPLIIYRWNF